MNGLYLTNYSVKGIKSIDDWASLSFYKKTYSGDLKMNDYCIKGIYGANGAGKSAIITSVKILKEIITNVRYLNDSLVQQKLSELINKSLGRLDFEIEFLYSNKIRKLYQYRLSVCKDSFGNYQIMQEELSSRAAKSHAEKFSSVFKVENGEIQYLKANEDTRNLFYEKTKNLLKNSSLTTVMLNNADSLVGSNESLSLDLFILLLLGINLYPYLEEADDHTDYFINNLLLNQEKEYIKNDLPFKEISLFPLHPGQMIVSKMHYDKYEKRIGQLKNFLKIFKPELVDIDIDKKNYSESSISLNLIMDYGEYKVNAEFESTGIKKLIKLYSYFQMMVEGGIVFVDEMDANLHDVYLCALLEYLMEHGKGQLCFTTHNIGPMDVLKRNKKSIDFLSVNHKIYPWVTNGNYSPSKLYKNGMIEGSPFNIDSVDFLSAFDDGEGE